MSVDQKTKVTTANKYLGIYNAPIDWQPYIDELKDQLVKRIGQDAMRDELRKRIACTILLPAYEPNTIQDPPQNLLYFCHKWAQFGSRDWVAEYDRIQKQDEANAEVRNRCLDLGFIYSYEYNPITRQAFNWMFERAEKSGAVNPDTKASIVSKFQSMVFAYGGAVICSVFQKPELEYKIKKIPNWRSGYFFERLINQTYSPEEIVKIKTHELNKVRGVDPQLIKKRKPKE